MIIIALFLRLVFSVTDPGEEPGGGGVGGTGLPLFLDQTEARPQGPEKPFWRPGPP